MNEKVVSQHLQDCFVFLSITDTDFLKMARYAVKIPYFGSQVTRDVMNLCYNCYDQFHVAPGDHFWDELVGFLHKADEEKRSRYYNYVERVCNMEPPNKKYVMAKFSKFIQAQELQATLIDAAPLVERGQFDEARAMLQKALKAGIPSEEEGIEYPGNFPPSYHNEGFKEIICPTGIPIIDNGIKGIKRSQLICIFAGFKVGKTWGCCQIAKEGIIAGRNIVEISHEASQEEYEQRHDMMFGSLTSEEHEEEVEFKIYDNEGKYLESSSIIRDTIWNLEAVGEVRDRVRRFGGRAYIKKYPMGSCTIGEIERYLDYLETFKRFVPDILINDYVEKMNMPPASQGRDQINEAYIQLKRIADERNIAVVTASQIKTAWLEKKNISEAGAAAEDARKLGNIDLGLFFGADKRQARHGLMQAFVLVNRSGPQKFGCVVSRNLKVGQLCLDCWPLRFDEEEQQ